MAAAIDPAEIVDTHLHLWDIGLHRYRWLDPEMAPTALMGDLTPIRRNYLLDEYLAEAKPLGIMAAVHVEGGIEPVEGLGNTRWLQRMADETGFPQAIVAPATLESPDAQATLEAYREARNLRGVRQALNWVADPQVHGGKMPDRMGDAAWRRGFGLLARLGLSFDMQVDPVQMQDAAALANTFPDTVIIVDHLGMLVDQSPEGFAQWRRGMGFLAAQPNIAMKVSGLAMTNARWSIDSIRPMVLTAIDLFGPDKIVFGSNFPVDKLRSRLSDITAAVKTTTAELTAEENTKLLSLNAKRIYRIKN